MGRIPVESLRPAPATIEAYPLPERGMVLRSRHELQDAVVTGLDREEIGLLTFSNFAGYCLLCSGLPRTPTSPS